MTTLPVLDIGGWAFGINDHGLVVGREGVSGVSSAVIWEEGVMHDLNALITPETGWHLDEARAINDAGIIVGVGSVPGAPVLGEDIFLLTPITLNLNSAVPGIAGEPNTFEISGATPGGRVILMSSPKAGLRNLSGCNGGVLSLNKPRNLGSAVADATGNATVSVNISNNFSGRTLLVQAVHLDTCEISDVVTQTF